VLAEESTRGGSAVGVPAQAVRNAAAASAVQRKVEIASVFMVVP
jgi:hypothetical protein